MKRGADDEALSWGDENDPTYVAPELDDDPDDGSTAAAKQGDVTGSTRSSSATAAVEPVAGADSVAVADTHNHRADSTDDIAIDEEHVDEPLDDEDLVGTEDATLQLSTAALIGFAIVGGIFFLYTIAWFISLLRSAPDGGSVAGIVQVALTVLAVAAPVLWFAGALFIAHRRAVWVRLVWLLVGVVVLVPWPYITWRPTA